MTSKNPNTFNENDTLLLCLRWLSNYFERPRSETALVAGLGGYEGFLSSSQFIIAAKRAGLECKESKTPLDEIDKNFLPVILILKNKTACILVGQSQNELKVVMPQKSDGIVSLPFNDLNQLYSGKLIFTKPSFESIEKLVTETDTHWFWEPLTKNWSIFINILVASFLINLFALTTPLFIKIVYDRVVPNNALETLAALSIGAIIIFIFDFVIRSMRGYFVEVAGQRADVEMSNQIFHHVMDIQLGSKPSKIGAFANRLREFEAVREFFTSATVTAMIDMPFIIFYIIVIYIIAGNLALVPLAVTVLVLSVGLLVHIPLSKLARKSSKDSEARHALLVDSLSGLETIKISGASGRLLGFWNKITNATTKKAGKSRLLSLSAINTTITASQIAGIIIIILGVIMIGEGKLTAGTLIAVVILNGRAVGSLGQVAGLLVRLNNAFTAYKSLNKIMHLPVETPINKNFLHRPSLKGNIEFKDVSFSYPGESEKILNKISFSIPQGSSVGLIGRIGSGKTTILKLILNLYEPSSGSILIDGTDIRQINPHDLRKNMGAALQDAHFFNGSIRENIIFGLIGISDEQINWAMKLTGLNYFVENHPHGLDMLIGERGEALSNGQRQSIILTRTLLRDPPILLLDEPTSMMDSPTESHIQKTLKDIFTDRTLILITHRATLLNSVDHLIVIDKGIVVAQGPRDEVLQAISSGKVPAAENRYE